MRQALPFLLIALLAVGCQPEPPPSAAAERLATLSPLARTQLQRGQQALDARAFARGLQHADTLARLAPGLPEADFLRGRLLFELGHYDEAQAAYEAALAADPALEGIRHNLGNIAFQQRRYTDAVRWYRAEADRFDAPRPWHGLGGTYTALGQADSARIAYETALARDSTYAPARRSLAAWHETEGDFAEALRLLRPLHARHPNDLDLTYRVGALLARTGQPTAAVPLLRRVVDAQPWQFSAGFALGQALQQAGQLEEAETVLAEADRVRTEQEAVEWLERRVRDNPTNAAHHAALADAFRRTGRLADARASYEVALGLRPDNLLLQTNLAVLHLQTGEAPTGVRLLTNVLRADSTYAEAWLNLWLHYGRTGDRRRAAVAYDRARRYAPDHPTLRAFEARRAQAGQ